MGKYYIIVRGGNNPSRESCDYLASVDKDGTHFSSDIDNAIIFTDMDRCMFLARGLLAFCTVDVYSVKTETVYTFQHLW